ncbi:hypothetical protein HBI83_082930 [Parastagonospora nodorum]|nr:hypothetical protein HBI83_082930 [Parastagonospora nodorum]
MFQDRSASNSTQQCGLELRRTLRPNDDLTKDLKPVHTTRVGPVAFRDPGSEIPTDGEMRGCSKWGGPHTNSFVHLASLPTRQILFLSLPYQDTHRVQLTRFSFVSRCFLYTQE